MNVGDIVSIVGSKTEWKIVELGSTPGRTLASGYEEPSWEWADAKRADGKFPDFKTRASRSDCTVL